MSSGSPFSFASTPQRLHFTSFVQGVAGFGFERGGAVPRHRGQRCAGLRFQLARPASRGPPSRWIRCRRPPPRFPRSSRPPGAFRSPRGAGRPKTRCVWLSTNPGITTRPVGIDLARAARPWQLLDVAARVRLPQSTPSSISTAPFATIPRSRNAAPRRGPPSPRRVSNWRAPPDQRDHEPPRIGARKPALIRRMSMASGYPAST